VSESHPMSPTTVYGAAKAAGELYSRACMRRYGLPVTIVRSSRSSSRGSWPESPR
jgi:nucleoside-diphosphate-sugar epimerase